MALHYGRASLVYLHMYVHTTPRRRTCHLYKCMCVCVYVCVCVCVCVCVIGTPDFVNAYVRAKAVEIGNDVQKLSIITDPKIHYDLLRFCQHTRMGFLSRNLSPEVMMT